MKNVTTKLLAVAVVAMLAVACSSADKDKIARLEGKIAELENKSKSPSSAAPAAKPAKPEVKPEGPLPAFAFDKEEHDFGKIQQGDVVEYEFNFKNTGDAPLIISSATGSCGCTVPDWPKEPIGIGESGKIKVKFDSKGKSNVNRKTVTLTANTFPKQTKIYIKANIEVPATQTPS